jgi:hypothetical protein
MEPTYPSYPPYWHWSRLRQIDEWCSVCRGRQAAAPSGHVCKKGHGGAPPLTGLAKLAAAAAEL